MMTKILPIYKSMKDDLKDAEMMIDYATTFIHENDKDEAIYYISEASKRLDNFAKKHSKFTEYISKCEKNELCVMYYKCFIEWYEGIQSRLASVQKLNSAL